MHYLAGGHVPSVIWALISADRANINLTFKQGMVTDLAGCNAFEAANLC